MRVALYHNLPPGGAHRVVREFVRRAGPEVAVDVYTLDFGAHDSFAYSRNYDSQRGGPDDVRRRVLEPVRPGPLVRLTGRRGARVDWLQGVRRAEQRVAEQMNTEDYDVAYIHSCWYSHSPSLIGYLEVPSVYYLQEVRRATFEPGYSPKTEHRIRSLPAAASSQIVERTLGQRDCRAVANADVLICNSRYSAGTIYRAYGRRAQVVRLGVDEDTFHPSTDYISGRSSHVVSVGGLEAFKGHHLIVDALSRLPLLLRPSLHLVYERCDLHYRERLRSSAAHAGVTLIEHQGIRDEELAQLFQQAAATVLAAQLEPFGLVALESLATGTPVVAFAEGGYLETITDGVNGLLVPRDVDALAGGVAGVLSGVITNSPWDIRATVIPQWGWDTSVASQVDVLRSASSRWER